MSLFINTYAEEFCVLKMKEKNYLIKEQFQNHLCDVQWSKTYVKSFCMQYSLI